MRILVRPSHSFLLGDRLFVRDHIHSPAWMEPAICLRQRVAERGGEIHTWDMEPIHTADVVVFQDLPSRKKDVIEARRCAPRAKFVLQLVESPLGGRYRFLPINHCLFDSILTYCWTLCDQQRYFRYFLPIGYPPSNLPNPPFRLRKPLVMVNTNRWLGIWAQRNRGLTGLPFFGPVFSGWRVPLSALLRQNQGELYARRRRIARAADRTNSQLLDVFGLGWRGEPMSWAHRFIPNKPFKCAQGAFAGDKLELLQRYRFVLAFENVQANVGYISEKIFDAIYSGAVPIYLGDLAIADAVPPSCFVDARQFRSDYELLTFASRCPESEWRRLQDAGKEFLSSPSLRRFQPDTFADTVLAMLDAIVD